MAYDAYLLRGNGEQADKNPVFRLLESDHDLLVRALRRSATALPLLRRLEDFYRDALISGSEAGALQNEIAVVALIEPGLAQKLAPLMGAAETAQAQGMNLHFVAD